MKRTMFITSAGILTVVIMTAVLMANAQQISVGDPSLNVNGSPVLTAASIGGLSGEIVSASATASVGTATVLTTPSTGSFILTQFCTTAGFSVLSGSSFGQIVGSHTLSDLACTRYEPGVALPQNEVLTINGGSVTITGVLQP